MTKHSTNMTFLQTQEVTLIKFFCETKNQAGTKNTLHCRDLTSQAIIPLIAALQIRSGQFEMKHQSGRLCSGVK